MKKIFFCTKLLLAISVSTTAMAQEQENIYNQVVQETRNENVFSPNEETHFGHYARAYAPVGLVGITSIGTLAKGAVARSSATKLLEGTANRLPAKLASDPVSKKGILYPKDVTDKAAKNKSKKAFCPFSTGFNIAATGVHLAGITIPPVILNAELEAVKNSDKFKENFAARADANDLFQNFDAAEGIVQDDYYDLQIELLKTTKKALITKETFHSTSFALAMSSVASSLVEMKNGYKWCAANLVSSLPLMVTDGVYLGITAYQIVKTDSKIQKVEESKSGITSSN